MSLFRESIPGFTCKAIVQAPFTVDLAIPVYPSSAHGYVWSSSLIAGKKTFKKIGTIVCCPRVFASSPVEPDILCLVLQCFLDNWEQRGEANHITIGSRIKHMPYENESSSTYPYNVGLSWIAHKQVTCSGRSHTSRWLISHVENEPEQWLTRGHNKIPARIPSCYICHPGFPWVQ